MSEEDGLVEGLAAWDVQPEDEPGFEVVQEPFPVLVEELGDVS